MDRVRGGNLEEGRSPWVGVIPVAIGMFMVVLDISILNVALPSISQNFDAKTSDVQWIINAYTITLVVLLITAGRIGDMVQRNYYFAAGIGIFVVGSYLCAESWDINSIIAFRALQATGGAVVMSNSLAIMVELFPPGKRGTVMGINSILIASAFSLGPIMGGWLTTHLSWHWVFYINVPIGIVGIMLGVSLLPSLKAKVKQSLDLIGLILFAMGLGFFTLGAIKGQDWGWTSQKTLACFIIAFPYIGAFIAREIYFHLPLLDLNLFRIRNFSVGILTILLMFIGLSATLFLLPFFLQGIKGLTAEESGYWLLAIPIMNTIFAPIAGKMSDKVDPKFIIIGPLCFITGLFLLTGIDIEITFWELFGILSILGIGMGFLMAPALNVIMSSVPPQKAGVANGVVQTMNSLGQTMGVTVSGVLFTEKMNDLIPGYGNQLPDPGQIKFLQVLALQGSSALYMVVDSFMESMHHVFFNVIPFIFVGLVVILIFLKGEEHLKIMRSNQ